MYITLIDEFFEATCSNYIYGGRARRMQAQCATRRQLMASISSSQQ